MAKKYEETNTCLVKDVLDATLNAVKSKSMALSKNKEKVRHRLS